MQKTASFLLVTIGNWRMDSAASIQKIFMGIYFVL